MKLTIDQAIGSTIKYNIDWSDDLETGELINASVFIVPAELNQSFADFDGPITSVYISNATGENNDIFEITNQVTVDNPDGHQRLLDEFTFRVRLLPTLYR